MDKGESISIPTKDIGEPHFHRGQGGKREMVHPGNDQFVSGDKIDRPKAGRAAVRAQVKARPRIRGRRG